MAYRYRVRRESQEQAWSKLLSLMGALAKVRQMARWFKGPYRIRRRGDSWGPKLGRGELLVRLARHLRRSDAGDVWIVEGRSDNIVIRKVQVNLTIDTPGVDGIDRIYTVIVRTFTGVENWGICNCRYIDGTTTWSQHAYCRAWDIHHDSVAVMDDIARYLNAHKVELGIALVLWRVDGHWDHIHVDLEPHWSFRPDCAG